MSAFENAQKFFDACETGAGWAGCQPYVASNATFAAQSEPLMETQTVQDYCEWMAAIANVVAPGASYELHASSFDEANRKAMFFATFSGKHTGEGGPVPPTNRATNSHYVYVLKMNDDDKVEDMVKIWNAPWAMRELGWAD